MLNRESWRFPITITRPAVVMTDLAIVTASTKSGLHEIASQATGLAVGLQNAAPSDKLNTSNKSIQYLFDVADCLEKLAEECEKLLPPESKRSSRP